MDYHWLTKLEKFGIDEPFLAVLVAKIGNEITWQNTVRNEEVVEYQGRNNNSPTDWFDNIDLFINHFGRTIRQRPATVTA